MSSSFNIPNALSVFRILLVPLFFYLTVTDDFFAAAIVFCFAGATDALDGFIARRYNLRTDLGAFLDPAADKLLQATAYLTLTFKGIIPIWLCVPVILRDVILILIYFTLRGAGRSVVISPSVFGKAATILQIITVAYVLFFLGELNLVLFLVLAIVTAALTLYAGLNYAWREYKILTGGT